MSGSSAGHLSASCSAARVTGSKGPGRCAATAHASIAHFPGGDEADGGKIIGSQPDGGTSWDDDEPQSGGVLGYFGTAANQALFGDYTPDENRNALGTGLEIGVGFVPIASTIASARDLSQNLSNWQWSWGHGFKTAGNVLGLIPLGRGLVSSGKAVAPRI